MYVWSTAVSMDPLIWSMNTDMDIIRCREGLQAILRSLCFASLAGDGWQALSRPQETVGQTRRAVESFWASAKIRHLPGVSSVPSLHSSWMGEAAANILLLLRFIVKPGEFTHRSLILIL